MHRKRTTILGKIWLLRPNFIISQIQDLDLPALKQSGVRYLVIDVDDTIAPHKQNDVSQEIQSYLKELVQTGTIAGLYVASNSRRDLSDVAAAVNATGIIRSTILSRKPLQPHFKMILREIGCKPGEAAMIGDRLSTDILGGNLAGMTTVLVAPLGPGSLKRLWNRLAQP